MVPGGSDDGGGGAGGGEGKYSEREGRVAWGWAGCTKRRRLTYGLYT